MFICVAFSLQFSLEFWLPIALKCNGQLNGTLKQRNCVVYCLAVSLTSSYMMSPLPVFVLCMCSFLTRSRGNAHSSSSSLCSVNSLWVITSVTILKSKHFPFCQLYVKKNKIKNASLVSTLHLSVLNCPTQDGSLCADVYLLCVLQHNLTDCKYLTFLQTTDTWNNDVLLMTLHTNVSLI